MSWSTVGGLHLTASITNEAVDELGLAPGMAATAVVKASDVMIGDRVTSGTQNATGRDAGGTVIGDRACHPARLRRPEPVLIAALHTASSPLLRELRLDRGTARYGARTGTWRSCGFLACLSYLFVPLDIIPDRMRLCGASGRGDRGAARAARRATVRLPRPQHASARHAAAARRRALAGRVGIGRVRGCARQAPVMRLMLGRWPDRGRDRVQHFRHGLRQNGARPAAAAARDRPCTERRAGW